MTFAGLVLGEEERTEHIRVQSSLPPTATGHPTDIIARSAYFDNIHCRVGPPLILLSIATVLKKSLQIINKI
jgi:hypothetical protein